MHDVDLGVIFERSSSCEQDCTILLIHGTRAAYFPSPYVDAYGERHRSTRGRPLYLDARRYAVVRDLWVKHLVAREVRQTILVLLHSKTVTNRFMYHGDSAHKVIFGFIRLG